MSEGERLRIHEGRLGRLLVVRLPPGADIMDSLHQTARDRGLGHGLIIGGVASLSQAVLRNVRRFPDPFPITDAIRVFSEVQGPLELLSISGNISTKVDGEIEVHCHGVISTGTPDAVAYGGHLLPGLTVLSTAELALVETEGIAMNRRFDDETQVLELYPEA